jgi:hypothetical protein
MLKFAGRRTAEPECRKISDMQTPSRPIASVLLPLAQSAIASKSELTRLKPLNGAAS